MGTSWRYPAVTISGGNSASASFTAPGVAATGDLVFRLTVTDNDGATGSDTVTITVNDVPPPTVLNWSIELNDPTGVLGITRPLLITGSLSNSPSSNVNLGIIGGFQGIPPGFDFEVSGFASTSTGYLFDWAPDGGESFINQFEGVDLSPGESFDFEFAKLAPNELVTSGTVYTTSLELQLYDAPRSGPMIGSSFDSISWTAVDDFGLVFVTSAPYAGGNLGGVSGADAICSQHAVDAGLGGTWTAWLSNPTINAKDRLAAAGALGPYRNTFNKIVALDLDDLTDGMLDISSGGFRYDENGQETNTRRYIWTSTDADGTAYLGGSCGTDWNDVNALGLVGDREQDDSGWTRVTFPPDGRLQSCSDELSIYCFKGNAVP